MFFWELLWSSVTSCAQFPSVDELQPGAGGTNLSHHNHGPKHTRKGFSIATELVNCNKPEAIPGEEVFTPSLPCSPPAWVNHATSVFNSLVQSNMFLKEKPAIIT